MAAKRPGGVTLRMTTTFPHPAACGRYPSPEPKSDVSDFGHLGMPNSGKPEFGCGGGINLTAVVETLATLGKAQLPAQIARWLDGLDETGRWALLKLVTGGLRIGVSARLAKTAAASLGDKEADDVELLWPGLTPPYTDLFAWLEGRADKPSTRDPAPFRPPMLAHAVEDTDFTALDAADFMAEWKWDGIRIQAVAGTDEHGDTVARLYSRTGEDISKSFPDLLESLRLPAAIDGELLIMREGRVQSFNVLQQRLNRKAVTPKLHRRVPRASARLRFARRRRRRSARPALHRAPRATRTVHRCTGRSAHRHLASGAVRHLGRARCRARQSGRGRRR